MSVISVDQTSIFVVQQPEHREIQQLHHAPLYHLSLLCSEGRQSVRIRTEALRDCHIAREVGGRGLLSLAGLDESRSNSIAETIPERIVVGTAESIRKRLHRLLTSESERGEACDVQKGYVLVSLREIDLALQKPFSGPLLPVLRTTLGCCEPSI